MTYATQAQIELAAGGHATFVSLTARDNGVDIDPALVAEAQARADGWIDGYLRLRYATPIANPSDTLIRIAADEAVYWLRSTTPGGAMLSPHDIDRRKERERELEAMRKGELRPDEPAPARSTAVKSAIITNDALDVSRETLKGIW